MDSCGGISWELSWPSANVMVKKEKDVCFRSQAQLSHLPCSATSAGCGGWRLEFQRSSPSMLHGPCFEIPFSYFSGSSTSPTATSFRSSSLSFDAGDHSFNTHRKRGQSAIKGSAVFARRKSTGELRSLHRSRRSMSSLEALRDSA